MTILALVVLVLAHDVTAPPSATPSAEPGKRPAPASTPATPKTPPDMADVQAQAERILELLRAEGGEAQRRD